MNMILDLDLRGLSSDPCSTMDSLRVCDLITISQCQDPQMKIISDNYT